MGKGMNTQAHHLRKGRDWFGIEVNRILAVESMDLPRALLGHWLVLLAYAATQSTGGRIRRADGRPIKAFPSLRISAADLQALLRQRLVRRVGRCLVVVGYDLDREKRFHVQSKAGRVAANRRWDRVGGHPIDLAGNDARGYANRNACGNADQRKEQKKDPPKAPQGDRDNSGDDSDGFQAFWAVLPSFLQQRRTDAVREWRKLGLDRDQVAQQRILKALERQGRSMAWLEANRKLNLTPKMYLRGRRWEDGPDPQAERQARPSKNVARAVETSGTPEERQARFRAEWEADPDNAGKTLPGVSDPISGIAGDLAVIISARGNAQ
jgi:hypothetical protein